MRFFKVWRMIERLQRCWGLRILFFIVRRRKSVCKEKFIFIRSFRIIFVVLDHFINVSYGLDIAWRMLYLYVLIKRSFRAIGFITVHNWTSEMSQYLFSRSSVPFCLVLGSLGIRRNWVRRNFFQFQAAIGLNKRQEVDLRIRKRKCLTLSLDEFCWSYSCWNCSQRREQRRDLTVNRIESHVSVLDTWLNLEFEKKVQLKWRHESQWVNGKIRISRRTEGVKVKHVSNW